MGQQFIRTYNLFVTNPNVTALNEVAPNSASQALDLSNLHFRFKIMAPDVQTPNTATIRIWNVATGGPNGEPNTAAAIEKEYSYVVIRAGYEGSPLGQIFSGTIKQVRKGRASAIDSYIDIYAADGDAAYNFSTIGTTLEKGATDQQVAGAVFDAMKTNGVATATPFTGGSGGILPRGKVMFGMARSQARRLAQTTGMGWSIQNGVLQWVPLTGYLPGPPIKLTSKTGLIGVPETTEDGIKARCLINPNIRVGGLVNIDNASINSVQINQQGFPDYTSINAFASTSQDGFYKVIMNEMEGDTRGDEWYMDLTCLSVDTSAAKGSQVDPYGSP